MAGVKPFRALFKLFFWVLATAAIAVALIVSLLFFAEPNLYRGYLEDYLSQAFDRTVVFEGGIELQPSLNPRLTIADLRVANPDWASRPYMLEVDSFDVRVRLLPLLKGELEILSMNFAGVDLLLEDNGDGDANYSFGGSPQQRVLLPMVESLSLQNAVIGFPGAEHALNPLRIEKATASYHPMEAFTIDGNLLVNAVPVNLSLQGRAATESLGNPLWRIDLAGEAAGASVKVTGAGVDPADPLRTAYRVDLQGERLSDLSQLLGLDLKASAPFAVGAIVGFRTEEHLQVDELVARVGDSALQGSLDWRMNRPRQALQVRLDVEKLDLAETGLDALLQDCEGVQCTENLSQPLAIGPLYAMDLDLEARVQRLEGLALVVQDLQITAAADGQDFRLERLQALIEGTPIAARGQMPWGDRLAALTPVVVTPADLLSQADLRLEVSELELPDQWVHPLTGEPVKLRVAAVTASVKPEKPINLVVESTVDEHPVDVRLSAEPLSLLLQHPEGPWRNLLLEAEGAGLRLDAKGSVARPLEAAGLEIEFRFEGDGSGGLLPLNQGFSLSGHYSEYPGNRVLERIKLRIGDSDASGRIVLHHDPDGYRLLTDLDANQVLLDDILPLVGGEGDGAPERMPANIADALERLDVDVSLRVQRLSGLDRPLTAVAISGKSEGRTLRLRPLRATLDGVRLDGEARLPWGAPLGIPLSGGDAMAALAGAMTASVSAQLPPGKLGYQSTGGDLRLDFNVQRVETSVQPGQPLQISTHSLFNGQPVELLVHLEPLARLLQFPAGPWRNLTAEGTIGDIAFQARGSVDEPLQAREFDIGYEITAPEIDALLRLFDFELAVEGALSVAGRYADSPDRMLFDDLVVRAGQSDLAGRVSLSLGGRRPEVQATLSSQLIDLGGMPPAAGEQPVSDSTGAVIPDFKLPAEALRALDGDLRFQADKVRALGLDLGDLELTAALKDGVFRLDPFRVRGWGGALLDTATEFDGSQDPPSVDLRWNARRIDYGKLLKQVGLAETVEGDLDVTLRLSGSGYSHRELLANADGNLVIVGKEGAFGSRRLDLWGSDLLVTMLSRRWRSEDVTRFNCVVAKIGIEDGIAKSDEMLVDTQRITVGAAGTLNLATEGLDLVLAPRPKRTSLVSLTNPVRVRGTLAEPKVSVTVLPRNRREMLGTGLLAGLVNPGLLVFTFSRRGTGESNPCEAAVEQAMAIKAE